MADDYSIDTGLKRQFGTVDYVLFSLMFCASGAIGFYHAYRDRNKKKTEDFHLGGRKMHPIPVSLSLSATFLSALTLLGTPSEVYTNGTMFYWIIIAMLIATGGAAHIFLPVFYHLNKISCFQYLEMRFGKVTRVIVSILFLLQTLVYMGFVLYAPSLAFEAVTGVSLWGCMIGTAAVCTLYTTLGGMKTVLWTDTLQFGIMVTGLLAVLIRGSSATGGFANAWEIATQNGRITFDDFSFDPKTRHSVWTVAIGGSFFWLYLYGINQAQIQRACSLRTLKLAQIAMWLNFPGLVLIVTLTVLIGVVMYAFYSTCHPVAFGLINKSDQLLPLFVLDTLGMVPGLTGVFVACVFSGGLSTISSGLNAMSAVLLEDFIKPSCCGDIVKRHGIMLSKLLVVIIGVVQFGVAVLISRFTGLILQFSYSMYSITAGPIFGVFVAGMFFPWTNELGVVPGFLASVAFMCWLGVGTLIEKPSGYKPLPTFTTGCNWTVVNGPTSTLMTSSLMSTASTPMAPVAGALSDEPVLNDFYRISYQWYTGLGMIICVCISVCTSLLAKCEEGKQADSRLMVPIFDILFPCLPEKILKPLRFGIVYDKQETEKDYVDEKIDTENKQKELSLDNIAYVNDSEDSTFPSTKL